MWNKSTKKFTAKWELAYAAKKLRQEHTVTLTCLPSETTGIIEILGSFSNSNPVLKNTIPKPHSKEVMLEIVNLL